MAPQGICSLGACVPVLCHGLSNGPCHPGTVLHKEDLHEVLKLQLPGGRCFQKKMFQLSATAFLILSHSFSTKKSVEAFFKLNMLFREKTMSY